MTDDVVEFPPPVPARAFDDDTIRWERTRRSRARFLANIIAAAALLAIVTAATVYIQAGTP